MIFLAAYDIQDDGVRAKVAKVLEAWGFSRVQRSVYVGRLTRARAQDLLRVVERLLKPGDHLLLIPITEEQLRARLEAGRAPFNPPVAPMEVAVLEV